VRARRKRSAAVPTLLTALLGCFRPPSTVPVEPGATFAAHPSEDGFVLDRTQAGSPALLARPGRLQGANAPSFVLRAGGETRAALWIVGHSRVIVRADASTIAPRTGEVLSTWDGGAVRLTIYEPDDSALRTDVFAREGEGGGPSALTRSLPSEADPSGTYRAAVRDGQGAPVGWMRVRIARPAPPLYDAVLPVGVGDPLAAAAVVVLDGEIEWIAAHAAEGAP